MEILFVLYKNIKQFYSSENMYDWNYNLIKFLNIHTVSTFNAV
jgi:hypothetical protein